MTSTQLSQSIASVLNEDPEARGTLLRYARQIQTVHQQTTDQVAKLRKVLRYCQEQNTVPTVEEWSLGAKGTEACMRSMIAKGASEEDPVYTYTALVGNTIERKVAVHRLRESLSQSDLSDTKDAESLLDALDQNSIDGLTIEAASNGGLQIDECTAGKPGFEGPTTQVVTFLEQFKTNLSRPQDS